MKQINAQKLIYKQKLSLKGQRSGTARFFPVLVRATMDGAASGSCVIPVATKSFKGHHNLSL
jgi:hypothetical protein